MPTYHIKNNQTGQIMTVQGDTPPSLDDADQLWQQHQSPQQQQSGPSVGGFLGNLLGSAGNAAGGVVNAVSHPLQTAKNLVKLPFGEGEVIASKIVGNPNNYSDSNMQLANGVNNMYANRYGGLDKILNTLYTDPVGSAMDAATVLDGAGAIGDASKIGSLSKLGDVGNAINPLNVAAKGVTKPASFLAGKVGIGGNVAAPFAKYHNPDVVQAANDLGVKNLPVSAVSKSNVVRLGEAIASKSIFGQKLLDQVGNAYQQLNDIRSGITNSITQAPDLKAAGDAIKGSFQNFKDTFNNTKGQLYDAVPDTVKLAPANTSNTMQALQSIIANKSGDLSGDSNAGYYQKLLSNIKNAGSPEINLQNTLFPDKDPAVNATQGVGGLTFNHLKQTRTAIGNKLSNHNDPIATGDKASLKQLYSALSQDLDATATNADPNVGGAIQKANQYYKDNITKINSPLGKLIQNSDPEKLVEKLVTPNSETQISHIKEIVGDQGLQPLQHQFLNNLFTKSVGKDGMIDGAKLQNNISRYGLSTIKALISPDQLDKLQQLQEKLGKVDTVKNALDSGTKLANNSQTAFLGNGMALMGLLNLPATLKFGAAQFGLSKMLESALGRKYLTTGINLPSSNGVSKIGNIVKTAAGKGALYNQPFYRNQQNQ